MKWLREPLFHFLLLGALLFGLHALVKDPRVQSTNGKQIEVSASDIQMLRERWIKQWGQPPSEAQLRGLIKDLIREEILYREALALGLDRNDTIIRRWLAQKMEFLSQDMTVPTDPTDAELARYFKEHRDTYWTPARVSFSHIYFSKDLHGAATADYARRTLAELRSAADPPSQAPERGDRFMLQHDYPARSQQELIELFGRAFAAALFELAPGVWQGPVESSYGLHLVRVSEQIQSRLPDLSEVRDQVRQDVLDAQRRAANEAFYGNLRQRYEVVVDETAIAPALASLGMPSEEAQ
jgi:peptidyl-prolyl cis-trans isomerase C